MVGPADLDTFFLAALKLKSIKRAGWVSKAKVQHAESVADHTFATCAIAMVFADVFGLDTERVMRMVILHDLAESIVGDYMPGDISAEEKMEQEKNAMEGILRTLPGEIRLNYEQVWNEYLENQTDIARLVHRIDKLEMAMQASQYVGEGYDKESLEPFFNTAKKALGDADVIIGETFARFVSKHG
jgi:putative hydrolases of HD superfamily